jgi:hypothetical protein
MLRGCQQNFLEDVLYSYITLQNNKNRKNTGVNLYGRIDDLNHLMMRMMTQIPYSFLVSKSTFPGNGAKNACWAFLTSLPKVDLVF